MQIMTLIAALPGAVAQGLIWGIMAIGVYLTFRILDIADPWYTGGFDVTYSDVVEGCEAFLRYLQNIKKL